MEKVKLGLFVTCYDEKEAIEFALRSANSIYPNIPIFINCEGKIDFSGLKSEGLNLKAQHFEDTLSSVLKINEQNYLLPENQRAIINATVSIVKRIVFGWIFLRSEYILLHCPDTLIRGELNIPEGTELLGSRVNKFTWQKTNELLVKNGGLEITHFGAVPAIFRVDTFLEALEKTVSIPNFWNDLASSFYAPFSHDLLLPILFSLVGKIEEFNPEITECTRNPGWKLSTHPLLHQFREHYPKRINKYAN